MFIYFLKGQLHVWLRSWSSLLLIARWNIPSILHSLCWILTTSLNEWRSGITRIVLSRGWVLVICVRGSCCLVLARYRNLGLDMRVCWVSLLLISLLSCWWTLIYDSLLCLWGIAWALWSLNICYCLSIWDWIASLVHICWWLNTLPLAAWLLCLGSAISYSLSLNRNSLGWDILESTIICDCFSLRNWSLSRTSRARSRWRGKLFSSKLS